MTRKSLLILFLIGLVPILSACDDPQEKPLPLLEDPLRTGTIDFTGGGRIHYEITGPDWDTPNVPVGDTLVVMGEARVDGGLVLPERNHMAAYASDATPLLTFQPEWVGDGGPPAGTYEFDGVLEDAAGNRTAFFHAQGDLTVQGDGYTPIQVSASPLPHDTARLYSLEITHTYVSSGVTTSRVTRTDFAQTWKAPLPDTKLYQQIIRWGCEWLDGRFEDLGEATENQLADTLLLSMPKLVPLGYRYGSLVRPSPYTNKAEVFLDYKQSACGEFYGFFMDLVETQGIDANYLIFIFPNPTPEWYSMYQTIDIAALGRESKVWRYSDHGLVEVNGRVYDPTYTLIFENADQYEDYLFASFCYGAEGRCGRGNAWCLIPDGPQGICSDNEPGYDPELGFERWRGETY